jgi:hypothetical protein
VQNATAPFSIHDPDELTPIHLKLTAVNEVPCQTSLEDVPVLLVAMEQIPYQKWDLALRIVSLSLIFLMLKVIPLIDGCRTVFKIAIVSHRQPLLTLQDGDIDHDIVQKAIQQLLFVCRDATR